MTGLSRNWTKRMLDLKERLQQKIADHQATIAALQNQMKGIQDSIDVIGQIEDDEEDQP